jgi:hypothetical protein
LPSSFPMSSSLRYDALRSVSDDGVGRRKTGQRTGPNHAPSATAAALISPNAARAALMARKTSDRLPLDWRASQPAGPQAARGFARRSESFRGHSSCSRPPPKPRPGRRRSSSGITDLLAPSDARHSAFDSHADVYTSSLCIYTHIGCHAPRPVLGGRRWSGDRRDGSSVLGSDRANGMTYAYTYISPRAHRS